MLLVISLFSRDFLQTQFECFNTVDYYKVLVKNLIDVEHPNSFTEVYKPIAHWPVASSSLVS